MHEVEGRKNMKLTLIRHGVTQGNKYGIYYGSTDLPLLDEGVAELKERRSAGGYPTAPRYYTSTLQRTQQTIRILYGEEVVFTPVHELREMDFGVFEMRSARELQQDAEFLRWQNGTIATNRCPGGESFADVQKRALSAMEEILAAPEDAVCVLHGGVISVLLMAWFPEGTFGGYMPLPGTGWQVTFEDRKPVSLEKLPRQRA